MTRCRASTTNLLSLADVLRTVRDRRQVIVSSTHDEVLAKLSILSCGHPRPENATAVLTIDYWGETGPRVTPRCATLASLKPEFQLLAATDYDNLRDDLKEGRGVELG